MAFITASTAAAATPRGAQNLALAPSRSPSVLTEGDSVNVLHWPWAGRPLSFSGQASLGPV